MPTDLQGPLIQRRACRPDDELSQAEADFEAAVVSGLNANGSEPSDSASARPFQLPTFDSEQAEGSPGVDGDAADDAQFDLRIELGRTELRIEEAQQLKDGAVVPLDKFAGDPVDILVGGRLIARGELLVLNNNFCIRVAEILTSEF